MKESLRQAEDTWKNNLRQQFAYILALQEYIATLHQEVARLKSQVEYFAHEGRMVVPVDLATRVQEEVGTSRHASGATYPGRATAAN